MANSKPEKDEDREERIDMEIIVDAYDATELSMSWYCYLEQQLRFPFAATCVVKRAVRR